MSRPAYRADGAAATREAFYAIACDPRRPVVVEACAGAGKTWMLVSRILRALLDGAQPHEILAITFTRKAAGEMRERLHDWLREFAAPQTPDEKRIRELMQRGVPAEQARQQSATLAGLHEALLRSGRPVEIRTFHAWFMQLLRAAPLELLAELGLQPDVELIEDLDDHRGEVYRRFHAVLLGDAALRADHAALVAARGRSQVRKWLDAAWSRRIEIELADEAGVLDDSVAPAAGLWPELAGLAHPAQALQSGAWSETFRGLVRALALGGVKAQDAATGLVMALEQTDAAAMFALARDALFTQKGEPRKQLGKVAQLAEVQAALEDISVKVRQHDAHVEHRRMVRLARVLLAGFAAYKRERGLADMADLERCALVLLRDATLSGWVQERLDAHIRHLLIDEFQDTSPLQWHALHAWLSGYAGAGGGASGQRAPGVFIVGDPKQSIYRFRRAEPRVFEAARAFVAEALGGHVLECDHTRRNAPQLLEVLNPLFEAAQQADEFAGFRAHSTEIATLDGAAVLALPLVQRPPRAERAPKAAADAEPPPWRDSLTTARHEPDEVLREREAGLVASAIRELLATQQAAPDEIFVLCRKREPLRLVAQALQALHLPFAAVEESALMDAPEVRDLVCLLDVLASPRHRLSLARALRSPLFDASDADLIALAERASPHGDWWRALVELPHHSAVLQRASELLPRWRAAGQVLPPHDLLDRIVHEGGLRERLAASVPREQRVAALNAVDALLGVALTLDGARGATPYGFVRALRRRAIKVTPPAQPGAVQLLTIHGAKGLEAKVVFVMDTDPEARNAESAGLLVDWPVDSDRPRGCAFVYAEGTCAPSLQALLDQERAARSREELNGLYVAMTRARERLVLSAMQPHRRPAGPSWWQRLETRAGAWVVDATIAAAAERSSGDAPLTLDELPAWQPPPDAPAGVAPAGARSADTELTRLGKAVHRVLEWAGAPGHRAPADLGPWCEAAAREFGSAAAEVERLVCTILGSPDCARFFDAAALRWAGNEVGVAEGGEALRIDRLVALDDGGRIVWWVLDYKLQHQPQALEAYREQMHRYRRAVQAAQPDAAVRCAFITGAGEVVEVG